MEDTLESLRQVAPQWSLAGDHQLLNILQNTHQRIISKCKEVTDQLDVMAASLDDASIGLQNVNNRFMALSNSQFIESRVYDDDTDVATDAAPVKELPKTSSLESDLESIKRGLQVLGDAHETLTILHDSDTDTDSEDEAMARIVLRPKDMYSDRPLPHIIGTPAWKSKWHAGLVCSDSDSDSASRPERSRSEYSDSEPEPPSRHAKDATVSESSSGGVSARGETPPPPPPPAAPARPPPQLVQQEPPPPTKTVYKPQQPPPGLVFPDEPPPLDSSSESQDDDIFADLHKSQPYSTSRGADDLFRFPHERGGGADSPKDEDGDIFSDFAKPLPQPSAKQGPPLFPEQRNIFPEQRNMLPNKTQSVPNTEDTVDDGKSIKKPVGAISLFGSNKGTETIGAAILKRNRKPSTSGDDTGSGSDTPETQRTVQTKEKDIFDDLFAKSQKLNIKNVVKEDIVVVKKPEVVKTKVDLFSDNIFDDIDDIFTTNVVKKPENTQKSIFDDEDDLFSDIAAPKTVKSDAKSSDHKKSLFDSDDDELFGDKSKIISKSSATTSGSTKISKHNEEISKSNEIIKDGLSKESTSNNNNTKISKQHEQVTTNVETANDSTKISNIFDDDNDEDIFSNLKTNNKVQNKLSRNADSNLTKPGSKSIKSSSLFYDDDEELFTKPTESSKPIQKDIVIGNQGKTDDIFGNTDDDLFVGAITSSNLTKKDTASDETDRVVQSSDTLTNETIKSEHVLNTADITVKNTSTDTAKNVSSSGSASDVNIGYINNSYVTKSVIKSHESEDEFEQDFDDLQTSEDKTNKASQIKNIITETKNSDIYDNTNDLFAKPAQKHIDNNDARIGTPEFKDAIQTSSKIIDNTHTTETVTKNVPDVTERTHLEPNFPKISVIAATLTETPTTTATNTDKHSTTTEKDNNKAIIDNKDTQTSIFDDIFTEPPAFEKPKEPKKSKNVNALFDDDSDDEALFFKKNDVITDDTPDDFTLNQDRFDIFIDEPPDVDVHAKLTTDDELFGSLPVITKTDDEGAHKNEPKDNRIECDRTENKLDTINTSDNDIFDTLPKPAVPRSVNDNFDKNTGADTETLHFNTPKDFKNVNFIQDKDNNGNESSINVDKKINKVTKSDSDDVLFNSQPKTAIKPTNIEIDSVEDMLRLPKAEKPQTTLLKSEKLPELPKVETKDTDDEELFKSLPNSEKNTTLFETAINKNKETSNHSDDLFKTLPKDKPPTSPPKNADSDEDLFRSLPKNITLPHNQLPQKNPESSSEESPKKVGKLKTMNFNINVNALLPGASPKKQKTDQSPTEPQKPDSNTQTEQDSNTKSEQSNIAEIDSKMVKSVSFDDEPESGILDNKLSKERAKIQVKRRPSTRRARREAVRKSAIDIGDDSTDNSSSIDDPPKPHNQTQSHQPEIHKNEDLDKLVKNTGHLAEKSEKNIPRNIQTDVGPENPPGITARSSSRDVSTKIVYILNDEDIFNTPAVQNPGLNTLGNIYTEKNQDKTSDTSNFKFADTKRGTSNTLYSDSSSSKDNSNKVPTSSTLKSSKTTKSKVDSAKKGIFDSDSDEELFTVKREVKKVVKGPLFSDDDDDDLFGVKKKKEGKPQVSRSAVIKEPQKPAEPVFDDPLSMLGDDE